MAGGKNVIYVQGFYERRQPYVNSKPHNSMHNPIPVDDLSKQGPTKEVQPTTVTKIGAEGNKGRKVTDMATEASDKGNKRDGPLESNSEPKLFPIKDSISNKLLPIKALIILEKEVNEKP